MTPILDYILANAQGIAGVWNETGSGIPSLRSFVEKIAESAIYLIPEAETDTTAAREVDPAYYDTNEGVRMPWPSVWVEFRAYARGEDYIGDSAFLLVLRDDGYLACYTVTLTAGSPRYLVGPLILFLLEASELGRADTGVGHRYPLRPSIYAEPTKAAKVCDFVREMLSFINAASGVVDTLNQPTGDDQRKLRRVLGQGATWPPYHTLRAESAIVSASTVAARAARCMGPTPSEARN